jgi:hypothetical protein
MPLIEVGTIWLFASLNGRQALTLLAPMHEVNRLPGEPSAVYGNIEMLIPTVDALEMELASVAWHSALVRCMDGQTRSPRLGTIARGFAYVFQG